MSDQRFECTAHALTIYFVTMVDRDKMIDDASTNAEVKAWEAEEKRALDLVHEAFALDTADCNTREQAFVASLDFMRHCARDYVSSGIVRR